MKLTNLHGKGIRRFDALLSGSSQAVYDRPLLDRDNWIVVPTVGAMVTGWLLAVPRQRVLSFRDWAAKGGPPPLSVVEEVRVHLGLEPNEVIWFEHGPASAGTVVGCGLDHAHIHILLRPCFDRAAFFDRARLMSGFGWEETSALDCYSRLTPAKSYYAAGSEDRAISACDVETAGSQFFRRVIADLTGFNSDWDYRRFEHLPKIEETISMFKQLENVT